MASRAKLFDISTYQETPDIPGEVDYDKLASRVDGGFIRMMSGKDFDTDFKKFYAGLKGKTILSAYIWGKWKEYAAPQAREVCAALKDYPTDFTVSLDFEKYVNDSRLPTGYNCVQWILDWGDVYRKEFNKWPILYCNGDIAKNYIKPSKHPRLNELLEWPLWISYPGPESVIYSNGYLGLWKEWLMWQYSWTGDNNSLNGMEDYGVESHGIDLSYFNGDAEQFKKWAGVTVTPPPIVTPPTIIDMTAELNLIRNGTNVINMAVAEIERKQSGG